ncbi:MAG: hemolysin family protein [Tissierellia bacterium]|nr:hemolysin family protein [Tissierellia bacterium]
MDDGDGGISLQILIIVCLTLVNAFFAAAEMAIVSYNSNRIGLMAEEGDKRARLLLSISQDQTRFLSTIQVGITLAGFFSAGSAATSLSTLLGAYLKEQGLAYGETVAFVGITILISYITLIFGELVPKRIALQNSEATALRSARIIHIFYKFMSPFVSFLSFSTSLVLKVMGKYSDDVEEKISEEEIKSYLKVGQEQGVINTSGEEMMVNIMDFDDKLAHEIMTPRTSMYMIDYDDFSLETIGEMLESGYSRIPVYKDSQDNIIGITYIKDVFVEFNKQGYKHFDLDRVIKEPYFVPESKNIDLLLSELQNTKNYVAILIDEYGGFSGMVTIEDIVEEIVGEIEDEYDPDRPGIICKDTQTYIVEGSANLDDISHELNIHLESENHETISGLVIELLGFIPEEDDDKNHSVLYNDQIRLTELGVEDKRIKQVEIYLLEEEGQEEGQA